MLTSVFTWYRHWYESSPNLFKVKVCSMITIRFYFEIRWWWSMARQTYNTSNTILYNESIMNDFWFWFLTSDYPIHRMLSTLRNHILTCPGAKKSSCSRVDSAVKATAAWTWSSVTSGRVWRNKISRVVRSLRFTELWELSLQFDQRSWYSKTSIR